MLDGTEYFECDCGSDEHTLRFVYDASENELYTSVYLNQFRPWWKRIVVAIGYVFGYRCRYGHWDCFTLRAEDVERLANVLNRVSR